MCDTVRLFGPALLTRDSSQEREKGKPKRKLENSFLQLRSIFPSASEVGQEAEPWALKSGEWCGQGQDVMTVIYRVVFVQCISSVVIHKRTFNSSGSLIFLCEELL